MLLAKCLGLAACLYLFIVGIGGMGESFKLFGKGFSEQILKTTASPFVGLFIGILATSLVQSSSTTTSIIVGMVAGGAISIEGAIPMVMGANIGTTITNTIVSLGHLTRAVELRRAFAAATVHDFFNLLAVLVLFPLELLTGLLAKSARLLEELFQGAGGMMLANPLQAATKPVLEFLSALMKNHPILLLVFSVLLTFAMLACIVKLLRSLVLKKVESFFDEHLFKSAGRAMLFGLLLTVAVQSSSVTTSLIVPLAGAGILRVSQIFPYTMGSNVGTTVTAMLAALATGKPEAVTVAFAHLLFNLFGILLIWPVPWIRRTPIRLAEGLAALSVRHRLIALLYVVLIFFVIPLVLIVIFK
ncbi:MAG TPA: Na/Pi symporter [Candidatus Paceibacterota bacterium]|nr:Na/Pi symporter [Candidatus Paceibacterota bacterium]